MSKVVANLALAPLDDLILQRESLSYYARYVDDIFIVDKGTEPLPTDSTELIMGILPFRSKTSTDGIELHLDARRLMRRGSEFKLREAKLRTFHLRGKRGRDFLGAIARDLRMIGSERRAFLYSEAPGVESRLTGLIVGADTKRPVQVLRDVDRLKLEKYAASVAVRKAADAVELLDRNEAAKWSRARLGSLADVASDPDHWVDFLDLGLRILGVALRARDGRTVAALFRRYDRRLRAIQGTTAPVLAWNDREIVRPRARRSLLRWLELRQLEEVCAAVPLVRGTNGVARVNRSLERALTAGERKLGGTGVARRAMSLLRADLRTVDRETDLAGARPIDIPDAGEWGRIERTVRHGDRLTDLLRLADTFLRVCRSVEDRVFTGMSPARLLVMTRPPTVFDIAYRWARSGRSVEELTEIINATRGTRYTSGMITQSDDGVIDVSSHGLPAGWTTVKDSWIVLGNLRTDNGWFEAALRGRPRTPAVRLEGLKQIVNQARDRKRRHDRDTLLVLPGLSLPRLWLRELAARLLADDIGVITGLEYERSGRTVVNEAVGVFPAGAFRGAAVCIWQKTEPAVEEAALLARRNVRFRAPEPGERRKIVKTDYAALSVLICSELLDIRRRGDLLGKTDLVVVPAWNRDTATFDHTVQTTAGDLHCFVAVANNAQFSDCRVYAPRKERYERDACRLISPGEDETVGAPMRASDLRRFQLFSLGRLKTTSKITRLFKPIPPGYEYRRP